MNIVKDSPHVRLGIQRTIIITGPLVISNYVLFIRVILILASNAFAIISQRSYYVLQICTVLQLSKEKMFYIPKRR